MIFHLRTWLLLCAQVFELVSCASLSINRGSSSGAQEPQRAVNETALPINENTVPADPRLSQKDGSPQPVIIKTALSLDPSAVPEGLDSAKQTEILRNNDSIITRQEWYDRPNSGIIRPRDCYPVTYEEILCWNIFQGPWQQTSNILCGGGTITSTVSHTFLQGFQVQEGTFIPTKWLGDAVEKVVPAAAYVQSYSATTATGYGTTCASGAGCIQWLSPFLSTATVRKLNARVDQDGNLCSLDESNVAYGTFTTPMKFAACSGEDCGAAATWGECYIANIGGNPACPPPYTASLPGSPCPADFNPEYVPPKKD